MIVFVSHYLPCCRFGCVTDEKKRISIIAENGSILIVEKKQTQHHANDQTTMKTAIQYSSINGSKCICVKCYQRSFISASVAWERRSEATGPIEKSLAEWVCDTLLWVRKIEMGWREVKRSEHRTVRLLWWLWWSFTSRTIAIILISEVKGPSMQATFEYAELLDQFLFIG